jgi:hypothetical protein
MWTLAVMFTSAAVVIPENVNGVGVECVRAT